MMFRVKEPSQIKRILLSLALLYLDLLLESFLRFFNEGIGLINNRYKEVMQTVPLL